MKFFWLPLRYLKHYLIYEVNCAYTQESDEKGDIFITAVGKYFLSKHSKTF